MAVGVRAQPYRLDPPVNQETLPQIVTNIDEMFQMVFEDMLLLDEASGGGSGVDTVVNDTNVTGSISGTQLTLGFTGTLAIDRGGTGAAAFTPYAVVLGGTTGTGALQDVGAVGTAGDVLTSQGAATKPHWATPSAPDLNNVVPFFQKKLWTFHRESNAVGVGTWDTFGAATFASFDNTTPVLTTDTYSTFARCTTSGSLNGSGGLRNSTLDAPMTSHVPTLYFRFRTGSSITNTRYWIGIFDNTGQTTNPGTSTTGVNTGKHVALRYVDGTDSQWIASAGDGTTQTTSANIAAIAASTTYEVRIRFTSNLIAQVSVNGGTEQSVTLSTNANDTTPMTVAIYVFNNTASSHVIDVTGIEAIWK